MTAATCSSSSSGLSLSRFRKKRLIKWQDVLMFALATCLAAQEAEIQRLKCELEITRQERDLPKKVTAFLAEESQ